MFALAHHTHTLSTKIGRLACFFLFLPPVRGDGLILMSLGWWGPTSQIKGQKTDSIFLFSSNQHRSPTCNTARRIIHLDEKTRGNLSSNLTEKCHRFHFGLRLRSTPSVFVVSWKSGAVKRRDPWAIIKNWESQKWLFWYLLFRHSLHMASDCCPLISFF